MIAPIKPEIHKYAKCVGGPKDGQLIEIVSDRIHSHLDDEWTLEYILIKASAKSFRYIFNGMAARPKKGIRRGIRARERKANRRNT